MSLQVSWINSPLSPALALEDSMVDNVYSVASTFDWASFSFDAIFRGPVQIYLCNDAYAGIVFIIALAICNLKAAVLCLWGSVVGALFAVLIGVDINRVEQGLHSLSSVHSLIFYFLNFG